MVPFLDRSIIDMLQVLPSRRSRIALPSNPPRNLTTWASTLVVRLLTRVVAQALATSLEAAPVLPMLSSSVPHLKITANKRFNFVSTLHLYSHILDLLKSGAAQVIHKLYGRPGSILTSRVVRVPSFCVRITAATPSESPRKLQAHAPAATMRPPRYCHFRRGRCDRSRHQNCKHQG